MSNPRVLAFTGLRSQAKAVLRSVTCSVRSGTSWTPLTSDTAKTGHTSSPAKG
jgi:hypothetical protein